MENKFYKNYSFRQFKFLKTNGVKPISEGLNETTGKPFWVYEFDDEGRLARLLANWSRQYKD